MCIRDRVRIDKPAQWGGIIGALQDNGTYEKGWLLGYQNKNFCFAINSEGSSKLTYLTSPSDFQIGQWYHLVGIYDGVTQKLFVDGKIEQVDTPDNIYKNPKTAFVADFIGTTSLVSKQLAAELFNYNSAFSIRPENIKINNEQDSKSEFNSKVVITDIQFQGSYYKIICKANDLTLTALHYVDTQNTFKINLGDSLELSWDKIDITNIND